MQTYNLKNINYSYGQSLALDNISVDFRANKFHGIIGPNGCGKSTLLDHLVANKEPSTGYVLYRGKNLAQYKRQELAKQIALVPQDFNISFAYTVEEIIMMGRHPYISRFASPSKDDWQKVAEAMELIGISHYNKRYVNELSGGEKQRVVVARALAQDTPVLIFDEATSNLDIQYTLQIFKVAQKLVKEQGRTVIAVIHNMNLAAAYCDEITFMKAGQIVGHGATSDVMTPEIINDIFGVTCEVNHNSFSGVNQISYKY